MTEPRAPQSQSPFQPGDLIAGRYRIEAEAGRGGMAVVYRAQDERLHRTVAVKAPTTAEAVERLAREAEIAARVKSPNVVHVFDYVPGDDGTAVIVMPYFETTLHAELERHGPLPVDQALTMARHVAEALHAAHRAGVVHGDVKPSNIFLEDGEAFLGDFGASPAGGWADENGAFFGTPAYLAPEQIRDGRTTEASDCYGLGLVLYEALTGRPPFPDEEQEPAERARLHTDPLPPSRQRADIPGDVDDLVLRALVRHPAGRYPSARAFAEAIAVLAGQRASPAQAQTVRVRRDLTVDADRPGAASRQPEPEAYRSASLWAPLASGALGLASGFVLARDDATKALGLLAFLAGIGILIALAALLTRRVTWPASGAEPSSPASQEGVPGRPGVRRLWRQAGMAASVVDWEAVARSLLAAGLTVLAVHAWLTDLPGFPLWADRSFLPDGAAPVMAAVVAAGVAVGGVDQPQMGALGWGGLRWAVRLGELVALGLVVASALWPVPGFAAAALAFAVLSLLTTRRYTFVVALLAAAAWLPAVPMFVVPAMLALLCRSVFALPWAALVLPLAVLFAGFSGHDPGYLRSAGLFEPAAADSGVIVAIPPPSAGWIADQYSLMRAAPGEYWSGQAEALQNVLEGIDYLALAWYGMVWWGVVGVAQPQSQTFTVNAVRFLVALGLSAGGHALGSLVFGAAWHTEDLRPAVAAVVLSLLWLLVLRQPSRGPAHLPADPSPARGRIG